MASDENVGTEFTCPFCGRRIMGTHEEAKIVGAVAQALKEGKLLQKHSPFYCGQPVMDIHHMQDNATVSNFVHSFNVTNEEVQQPDWKLRYAS